MGSSRPVKLEVTRSGVIRRAENSDRSLSAGKVLPLGTMKAIVEGSGIALIDWFAG
jgi:hypothetical protein